MWAGRPKYTVDPSLAPLLNSRPTAQASAARQPLFLASISINVALKEGKDSVIGEAKNRIEEQNAMVTNISISSNGVLENQIMDWGF